MLKRKQRLQIASKIENIPYSIPAPYGGWNARDALDEMPPTDAVMLDNWYPDYAGLSVRNGFTIFATGVDSTAVQTLAEFNFGATRKFIAAAGNAFYDISSGGATGAPIASGFTNNAWQTATLNSHMFFANGSDNMQIYDGTSFSAAGFTGAPANNFVGVFQYQNRLFMWRPNDTIFYYAATLGAITGPLGSGFDVSGWTPHGGNIVAMVSYSHDGGNGVIDLLAVICSSGDVLVYFGNDPANPNAWQLVGIYRISPPVNIRSVCQYGAEAFLTTYDDHIPLQQQLVALKLGQLPPRSKVSTAVKNAVISNALGFGWQALYYPKGRRLIFNVPNPDGTFSQHIQNTALSAQPWCRFQNMNAFCWGLFKDNLFFGGAGGVVYQADNGNLDNLGVVQANAQQSWNQFEKPFKKRVTMVRPVIQATATGAYTFSLGYDYGAINVEIFATVGATGSPWDISPWDTSPWSPENVVDPHWKVGGGTGQAVGVLINAAANEPITWLRTDYRYTDTTGL